ncbi:MAG: hypothetical protein COV60_01730, partial [Candidatus Magasanikbacteria bacterium CG11_big_fil_rev_8_21_14_0_20_43_7]
MTSSSIDTTNGGYNPWSLSAAASSTFVLTTTTATLDTQNETVTIAMTADNSAPTLSSAISPAFATDGTGYTTVTTTLTDADGDSSTLFVEHSTDGGTTWASSTIATVS